MKDTKYIIETTSQREANLMMNATRMANVLYELLGWYRSTYNGKNYDNKILFDGKLYSSNEWMNLDKESIPSDKLDEHGLVKSGLAQHVYTEKQVEDKLDSLLSDIRDLINNYYE